MRNVDRWLVGRRCSVLPTTGALHSVASWEVHPCVVGPARSFQGPLPQSFQDCQPVRPTAADMRTLWFEKHVGRVTNPFERDIQI